LEKWNDGRVENLVMEKLAAFSLLGLTLCPCALPFALFKIEK
jgi:hypothetical protein